LPTRERAEDIAAEIVLFGNSLAKELVDEHYDKDGKLVSDESYWARVEHNRLVWEAANWPYSWEACQTSDFEPCRNNRPFLRFKSEFVKIVELPIV